MPEDIPVPPGFKLKQILPGHDYSGVGRVRWSPDGNILASSADDYNIRLWDFKSGRLIADFYAHEAIMNDMAWSLDGRFLASTARFEDGKIWDINERKLHAVVKDFETIDFAYSPNGRFLASYTWSELRILDAHTLELVSAVILGEKRHKIFPWPVRWSDNGEYLAAGSEKNSVYIFRTEDWGLHRIINIDSPTLGINDVLWMPDNNTVLVASGDPIYEYVHRVDVWDIQNNHLTTQLDSHYAVLALSLSANKTLVASKGNDGIVRFWRSNDWSNVATLPVITGGAGIEFHPSLPILALPYAEKEEGDFRIALWELDL